MSLLPFFNHPWEEFRGPSRLFDQHFGGGLHISDLMQLPYHDYRNMQPFQDSGRMQPFHDYGRTTYYRPWRHLHGQQSGTSSIHLDKDGFSVSLDVRHFTPEEVTVKHVGQNVVVEGKHEETPDEHGYVSRKFIRRYVLPKSVNADEMTSNLSSDGVLTITAPKVLPVEDTKVRPIPIQHTGQPAIKPHGKKPETAVNGEAAKAAKK